MQKIIGAKFKDSYGNKTYHYLTDIEGLQKGDYVVVDSPHRGYACVEVVSTEEDEIAVKHASKWVICKVDLEGYKARMEREKERKALIARLQKMQAEFLAENQFAMLAQTNPDAAALVEKLKELK